MSDQTPDVEWHKAVDFAEVAEALGVTTKQVMAVQNPQSGRPFVMYTLSADPNDTLLHAIHLSRSADGTLYADELPRPQPGLWEQIVDEADRRMEGGEGGGTRSA